MVCGVFSRWMFFINGLNFLLYSLKIGSLLAILGISLVYAPWMLSTILDTLVCTLSVVPN